MFSLFIKTSLIAQESIQVSYSWEHDILNSNVVLSKFFMKIAYFNVKCHGYVYIMNIHKYVQRTFLSKNHVHNIPHDSSRFPNTHNVPQTFPACSKVLITCESWNMYGFRHLCTWTTYNVWKIRIIKWDYEYGGKLPLESSVNRECVIYSRGIWQLSVVLKERERVDCCKLADEKK